MRQDDLKPYNQSESNHHDENETKRDIVETDAKQEESFVFSDRPEEQQPQSNHDLTLTSSDEYRGQQSARQSSKEKQIIRLALI